MGELMSGKQAVLEMLKAEGIEYIFGNPGTSEGPLIDMLGEYPEFKYIMALQESVAEAWVSHMPVQLRRQLS